MILYVHHFIQGGNQRLVGRFEGLDIDDASLSLAVSTVAIFKVSAFFSAAHWSYP